MYVRIIPIRFDLSREDEVVQVTNDVVIPLFRGLPGFRRYHGGVDRAQGSGVSITYWETREQAEGLSDAVRPIRPQLEAAGIELGSPAIFEVVAEG